MKKIIVLFLFIILAFSYTIAHGNNLIGSWLLIKAKTPERVIEPFIILKFDSKGKIKINKIEFGTWRYDQQKNEIVFNAPKLRFLNGTNNILKITDKSLVCKKGNSEFTYMKVNKNDILKNNKLSGLQGVWQIETDDNTSSEYIKFRGPDTLLIIKIQAGMKDTSRGEWIYSPNDKTIIFLIRTSPFKGFLKVKTLNDKQIVFEKKDTIIKAHKLLSEKNKIEKLSFKLNDFPENNEIDENKIPWRDFQKMISVLKNIKSVEFKRGELINELGVIKYSKLFSEIKVNSEKQTVLFTNFTISNNHPEQYSQNFKGGLNERYNYFFPMKEPYPYKIVGVEKTKVSAGEFECTVIEGFDGDNKIKYWMINDKPGIYAKKIIIKSLAGDVPLYLIYELKKINYRD